MCLACAAVAAPEVAVIVGGYAAVRVGRPVSRIRDALGRGRDVGPDGGAGADESETAASPPGVPVPLVLAGDPAP